MEDEFLTLAGQYYARELDLKKEDSDRLDINAGRDLAGGGNDPETIKALLDKFHERYDVLLKQPTSGDVHVYNRMILPLKNRAHFIAVLKSPEGAWFNYDSLEPTAIPIANIDTFLANEGNSRMYICGRG